MQRRNQTDDFVAVCVLRVGIERVQKNVVDIDGGDRVAINHI
jgi:hypothetical protein